MKIQEQIPENLPDWAEKAIKNGTFFKDAIAAVEDRNRLISEAIGYTMAAVCTNMESGFDPRKMEISSLQKHTIIALGIEDTFYT